MKYFRFFSNLATIYTHIYFILFDIRNYGFHLGILDTRPTSMTRLDLMLTPSVFKFKDTVRFGGNLTLHNCIFNLIKIFVLQEEGNLYQPPSPLDRPFPLFCIRPKGLISNYF